MIAKEDIDGLVKGHGNVMSPDGEKIGGIGQVYLDDDTDKPSWVTVKTGLFGLRESFVPLEGAWIQGE
ncbi:PRC-barrel domain-containing protein, partial [Arthrobacter sp. UYCu712]|uniref:PRC-barrel domain-containing protein n=1 Tax=Arthrobacter sp. UYCu712 TaxID=3156340 RepID=UPI0033938315